MKEKIKETIKAEIWDIKVGKRYYSFKYRTQRNGVWTPEYLTTPHTHALLPQYENTLKMAGR